MTDRPQVSIVITAYNYGRYLASALESALGQDYEPLEVLVLDNASTDETPEIVARYAGNPRLRSIRHPLNIGLTPNHNAGLARASGAFIAFLSADDVLLPGAAARAISWYAAHPDVDVLYGGAYFCDEAGAPARIRSWPGQPMAGYAGGRNELAQILAEGAFMCWPTLFVPRRIWDAHGGYDPALVSADWELTARWAFGGVRFGFDPHPYAMLRSHAQQNSGMAAHAASGREMRDYVTIYERYLDPRIPERYVGYEAALRRCIDNREQFTRAAFGADAVAEFTAAGADLRARLDAIVAANAVRERKRIAYVVLADDAVGPLALTLDSLAAQSDPAWRAVVVQQPGVSFAPLCARIDAARIRHAGLVAPATLAAAVNTGVAAEDADVYAVLRAGTVLGPGHTAAVRATFGDPAVRVALTWPQFFVDDVQRPFGVPRAVAALSAPPATGLDVTVAPLIAPEGVAFARTAFDALGGYRDAPELLADWDFLIRLSLGGGLRAAPGAVEVHVWPEQRDRRIAGPGAAAAVASVYATFPVVDAGRRAARADFAARLAAAPAERDAAGLRAFYEGIFAPA